MPRMRRGRPAPKAPPESDDERANRERLAWARANGVDLQCIWCGRIAEGPRKGPHTRLLGGDVSSTYCPDCRTEQEDSYHRDRERRTMEREGIPPERWPPRILSRLERQTGIDPTLPYDPATPEPPILHELEPPI